jgi:hypothetical protein
MKIVGSLLAFSMHAYQRLFAVVFASNSRRLCFHSVDIFLEVHFYQLVAEGIRKTVQPLRIRATERLINATESDIRFPRLRHKARTEMSANNTNTDRWDTLIFCGHRSVGKVPTFQSDIVLVTIRVEACFEGCFHGFGGLYSQHLHDMTVDCKVVVKTCSLQ